MDKKALQAFAKEAAKSLKTPEDLNEFSRMLTKVSVEAALNAELDEHLGYDRHEVSDSKNNRNGFSKKQLKTDSGEFELLIPRDREGSFEPQLVKKHQRRMTGMDEKILYLYAHGLSTREIVQAFEELYGAEVSPTLISKVTDAVLEQVKQWQARPLDAIYPIVYLDCIVIKVRKEGSVINRSVFLALGINTEGQKDLLGMWMADNEGAKFWLGVLTELQNRGVKDILIACVDGLKGFPDAINAVFPQTHIQLCIVHMVRNSLRFVSWKDYKAVTVDLKRVYQGATEQEALDALTDFSAKWDAKYPQIYKSWSQHWGNINTLFGYPKDIRKAIYTTNAIESLNSVIRKAVKKRKLFPNDESAQKVVYLAIKQASKKWTMPIRDWRGAMSRFIIEFGDRLTNHI
jgi:putative transposase